MKMPIGRILASHPNPGESTVEWHIRDFFSLTTGYHVSGHFPFCQERWSLQLYKGTVASGELSLYLCKQTGPPKAVAFVFGIRGLDDRAAAHAFGSGQIFFCVRDFCQISDLRNPGVVEDNHVIVSCHIKAASDENSCVQTDIAGLTEEDSDFPPDLDSLSRDLSNLLKSETLPDVRLKCRGRAIPAHRAVLAARSEVFAAMFRIEMSESRTGEVDLVDVDDDVIDPFLQYVYSGQVQSEVPEGVLPGLYATGDKYAVHPLVKTCRERMVDLLSEENCVGFLRVAHAHTDHHFKDRVVSFICDHSAVFRSDAWLDFAKEPSKLAIEVYQSFIVRRPVAGRLDEAPE